MKTKYKLLVLSLLLPFAGQAVLIGTETPNSNNSQPAGDQGWSSMGIYNGAGSVYLGAGWFITAGHLGTGAGTVKLGGTTYSINGSSWTSITNSNGSNADIRLFQISDPGAILSSGSQINSASLGLNYQLTMIGYGRDVSSVSKQGATIKYYQATVSQMKWGSNQISGFQSGYTGAGYTSEIFETTLGSGTAQALDKDSGGGVFIYDDVSENYLLAGVMIGASLYPDANGIYAVDSPTQKSKTYSVDLSVYGDQINQTIPEPSTAILLVGIAALLGVGHRIRCMLE